MKARLISVLLVIALLVTVGVLAVQAAHTDDQTYMNKLNGIYATAKTMSFTADVAESDGVVCPYCGAAKAWTALPAATGSTLASGHYYVPEGGLSNTKDYYLSDTNDYCIHLNGQTVTSTGIVFRTSTGSSTEVRIMGQGIVTTTATDKPAIQYACGIVQLFGGTYKPATDSTYPVIADQGVVAGTVSVYGTKRLFVCDGTDVQGTIECWKASAYMIGGHIQKAVLGTATEDVVTSTGTTTVATQNGYIGNYFTSTSYQTPEIGGTVVIDELDVSAETARTLSVKWLATGASITVSGVNEITDTLYAATAVDKTNATATAALPYFHAANEATHEIVVAGNETSGYYLASQLKAGVAECAACGETAQIIEVAEAPAETALAAGHYKLTADLELTAPLAVAENVCIDLNGHSVTSTGRVLEVTAGTVNVIGTGTVTGAATEGNAATILVSGGTLNLEGGTFKHDIASTLPTVYTAGTVTMETGATITADKGADDTVTTDDVIGYNVHVNGGTFTMNGGEISNATATKAGNVFVQAGTFTLKGGEIKDGTATGTSSTPNNNAGGNIHKYSGTVRIEGGTVSGGTARYGGNIYIRLGAFSMSGGTVTEGYAVQTGGNIYLNNMSANNDFDDCIISNGTANYGGNIRIGSTNANYAMRVRGGVQILGGTATRLGGSIYVEAGALTVSQTAQISGGVSDGSGGTIYVCAPQGGSYAEPVVNFIGGTFTGGSSVNGGFLFAQGGTVNVLGGTFNEGNGNKNDGSGKGNTFYMRAGTLLLDGGTFNCNGAQNAIYLGGYQTAIPTLILGQYEKEAWQLGNSVTINGTDAEEAIELNGLGILQVLDSFDDTVYVSLHSALVPSPYYGKTVLNATSSGDAATFTGKLFLGGVAGNPAILPATYTVTTVDEETQQETTDTVNGLRVAGALADGEWTTTADAFATATESIKLYETGAEVTISADTVPVDLNGKDITVSGAYTVNATNSSTSDASTVTLTDGATLAQTETAVWNTDHFDVVLDGENGAKTVHRLEMRIKSISLRPDTAGLYYTSEIIADDTLKAAINEIGVVLGVEVNEGYVDLAAMAAIADGDALEAATNMTFKGTTEVSSTVNSVLVNNIFKTGADNATRGTMVIHGAACVIFDNGDVAIAAAENYGRSYSMKDYMVLADSRFTDMSAANQQGLYNFYDTWSDVTSTWGLTNIAAYVPAASDET